MRPSPFVSFLALSLLAAGTAQAALPVSDIGDPKVYAAAERLAAAGIITGRDETARQTGLYRPNDDITLAEALRMSMIAAHYRFPTARVPSNLSAQGTWASGFVSAAEIGRFKAFMDNRTDVFRPATRTEVIQTLTEVFGITTGQIASFGITTSGNGPVTRGQFAIILSPLLTVTPSSVAPPSSVPPVVVASSSASSVAPVASSSSIAPAPSGANGVINGAVNVRWQPDVTANAMGSYPAGTPVVILDDGYEAWYFIRLPDGKEGYIVKKFVNRQ